MMATESHAANLAAVIQTNLIRSHWRAYLLVAMVTLVVHVAWLTVFGPAPSSDFQVVYAPHAISFLNWLAGGPPPPPLPAAYTWTHAGYIGFVAICFALFGMGSLKAVIYTQAAIAWLAYPLLFHMLLSASGRLKLSLVAIGVWLTFYDGYLWHFWAVPDSLFRLLFLTTFYLLWRLWVTEHKFAFVAVTVTSVLIGTMFRVEAVMYALPALWLSAMVVYRSNRWAALTGMLFVIGMGVMMRRWIGDIIDMMISFQTRGIILDGLGYHVPGLTILGPPTDTSIFGWAWHMIEIFARRLYWAVTPIPAFWSRSHQIYYAIYLIPAYFFLAIGTISAIQRRNMVFIAFLWIFACGLLLRMLVHVDPPLRYGYTAQAFLFLCAALGAGALFLPKRTGESQ